MYLVITIGRVFILGRIGNATSDLVPKIYSLVSLSLLEISSSSSVPANILYRRLKAANWTPVLTKVAKALFLSIGAIPVPFIVLSAILVTWRYAPKKATLCLAAVIPALAPFLLKLIISKALSEARRSFFVSAIVRAYTACLIALSPIEEKCAKLYLSRLHHPDLVSDIGASQYVASLSPDWDINSSPAAPIAFRAVLALVSGMYLETALGVKNPSLANVNANSLVT